VKIAIHSVLASPRDLRVQESLQVLVAYLCKGQSRA